MVHDYTPLFLNKNDIIKDYQFACLQMIEFNLSLIFWLSLWICYKPVSASGSDSFNVDYRSSYISKIG
jgi:hypothetical protein